MSGVAGAALTTLAAFLLLGLIPLLPFIWNYLNGSPATPYTLSAVLTGLAFFSIGTVKSHFVDQSWLLAGLESLLIGGSAAALTYVVGVLLKGIAA